MEVSIVEKAVVRLFFVCPLDVTTSFRGQTVVSTAFSIFELLIVAQSENDVRP
jgi:hypothetical protein